jgi:EpsI family protein
MTKTQKNAWLLLLVMLGAALLAYQLTPRQKMAELNPPINLEQLIPTTFGDWQQDTTQNLIIADPDQLRAMNKIYTQTLMRTYQHKNGYKIMLALAYGSDQSDFMEVHKPEICYPAQGFSLRNKQNTQLNIADRKIPITKIDTAMGARKESVTYWIVLGKNVVQGNIQKKIVQMRYGLVGQIPDGILVRASSIDDDVNRAYEQQKIFFNELVLALPPEQRSRLVGEPQ